MSGRKGGLGREIAVVALAVVSALTAGGAMLRLLGPQPAQAEAPRVAMAPDGHFWAEAEVDGRRLRLLVDTGASTVALTPADARRLGLDLARLDYRRRVFTAAGETRAAPVVLDHVSVAGARIDHVQALVLRDGLSASLLGMSYLGRLSRFEATPAGMALAR